MKSIGFPISRKENENRRALVPADIHGISHPELMFFEEGYGNFLGISDDEYRSVGCNVCSFEECLAQDIICDPKIGDATYLNRLRAGQTVFGWIHATQNRNITDAIVNGGLSAYAWENMYEKGRHVFWRNNELAGEAAVLHAFQCYGRMPYETKVAVIGRGNTARGAIRVLNMLGADVMQYDRRTEELLRDELSCYDVIVNCVLWDVERKDHIISRYDLAKMKKNALIIDVSCDRNGGIETSVPTTIEDPVYTVDGIVHYVVDHTPAIFYKTFTYNNSKIIAPYLSCLMEEQENEVLKGCLIIENGNILDEAINVYQGR